MGERKWIVYLVRCADGSLYCGITNNLKNRLKMHNAGKGARYTRSRQPVRPVAVSVEMAKRAALKLEYRIKQLPAGKKIMELKKERDNPKMNILKDLQKVKDTINAMVQTVSKIAAVVDEMGKADAEAVKEKPTKTHRAKKIAAAKPVKGKESKAPSAGKPSGKQTAGDTVLEIIKTSDSGINTPALMKKTGFNQKKVQNIVFKLKKQGKIKTVGKGMFGPA